MDDYLLAIDHLEARRIELDARLAEIAETEPYRERVGWLRCFRGIDTLTAMLILAELHDFRRFQSPRALMAYLGLVPGEDSSGEKHRRGRITRAGQRAGAPVAGGNGVALSTSAQESASRSRGDARANRAGPLRLPTKRISDSAGASDSLARQKPPPKIVVAVARELAGFLWAALQPPPQSLPQTPARSYGTGGHLQMRRLGVGPRRRRMIRGTIARIGG